MDDWVTTLSSCNGQTQSLFAIYPKDAVNKSQTCFGGKVSVYGLSVVIATPLLSIL